MTTLIQSVTGSLLFALLLRAAQPMLLTLLLTITSVALNISVFHLGRPAYAWRALKMWRRSWLSREVLLFGLFFGAIASFTLASWLLTPAIATLLHSSMLQQLHASPLTPPLLAALGWAAVLFGIAGTIASAFIYLVPARPAWNMMHTPIDFLLSSLFLGSTLPVTLSWMARLLNHLSLLQSLHLQPAATYPNWITAMTALPWIANHAIRLVRLNRSSLFEGRATAALLNTQNLRPAVIASFALAAAAGLLAFCGAFAFATAAAFIAVLLARYLFFVSVVPLNMALTFTRGGSH
jgi:DMSO reductase anchor subunit